MKKNIFVIFILIFSCERLYVPPKPPNVNEKSIYIHRFQQWHYVDDSIELVWYNDGSLYKKIEKRKELYHGTYKVFFRNGQISQIGNYNEGYRVGKWFYYFPDGKIYLIVSYEKEPYNQEIFTINGSYGNENGEYIRYYSNGKIEEKGYYLAGNLHGKRIHFYKNGKKQFEITYKNGKKDGIAQYFDLSGNLKKIVEYKDNQIINQKILY